MGKSLTLSWSLSFHDYKMRLDQIKLKVPEKLRNCNSELHSSCWYYFYLWSLFKLSTEMLFLSLVVSILRCRISQDLLWIWIKIVFGFAHRRWIYFHSECLDVWKSLQSEVPYALRHLKRISIEATQIDEGD